MRGMQWNEKNKKKIVALALLSVALFVAIGIFDAVQGSYAVSVPASSKNLSLEKCSLEIYEGSQGIFLTKDTITDNCIEFKAACLNIKNRAFTKIKCGWSDSDRSCICDVM